MALAACCTPSFPCRWRCNYVALISKPNFVSHIDPSENVLGHTGEPRGDRSAHGPLPTPGRQAAAAALGLLPSAHLIHGGPCAVPEATFPWLPSTFPHDRRLARGQKAFAKYVDEEGAFSPPSRRHSVRLLSAAAVRSSHHARGSGCPVDVPAVTSLAFSRVTGGRTAPSAERLMRARQCAIRSRWPRCPRGRVCQPRLATVGQIRVSKPLLWKKSLSLMV